MSDRPFLITGPFVLGKILRRNKERANMERVARMLGITIRSRRPNKSQVATPPEQK
jgi:hypothetical protein